MTVSQFLLHLLLLFLITDLSHATEFSGRVVSIQDGDTIEVLHNKKSERIRLTGIDCPEQKQAFGQRAQQVTSTFGFGQTNTARRDQVCW